MASRRTHIRKILPPAIVFLVLSGIVVAQFPELLSLIDDTTNDFTVRKTNTVVLSVLLGGSEVVRMSGLFSGSASGLLLSRPSPYDKLASAPSKLFLLHSDLRT